MASSRDREAWSYILKLYESLPYLWDKNNINYGNRSMMTDGYKILTRVYREKLDKQGSVGALRMKMKNLRTTYYRELRKINESKLKGDKYTPSLWYFDYLNFLGTPRPNETAAETSQIDSIEEPTQKRESVQIDSIQSNSTREDDLTFDNSDIELDLGPSTSQPKVIRDIEPRKLNDPALKKQDYLTDTARKKSMKDEHWEVIGKSIGYQLRDLSKKQYTIVSKLISDAIYFGRLNKLSEVSHIEIGSSPFSESHQQSPNTYSQSGHYSTGFHAIDVLSDQNQSSRFKSEDDCDDDD